MLAASKKKMMLTLRGGLLVVFQKSRSLSPRRKCELSSRLSHRVTVSTSLDCGKRNTERVKRVEKVFFMRGFQIFFEATKK